MKKYICTICGYIFDENEGVSWEELPDDWVCPLCGADKTAFELQEEGEMRRDEKQIPKNDAERELQSFEMAALCSNLAKSCEKQYLFEEAEAFINIGRYFEKKEELINEANFESLSHELSDEIKVTFKNAHRVIDAIGDRGAKRALVWSEKVTRMQKSILNNYEKQGDAYLADSKVYVCEICGFVYVGEEKPDVCPVCKVPNFKMKEIGRD